MEENVYENILNAQARQKTSYSKRFPQNDNVFHVGDEVLLKNLRREDRKGGWVFMPWIGPFTIHDIINKNTCVLKRGDTILKRKQLISNIKKYYKTNDADQDSFKQFEDNIPNILDENPPELPILSGCKNYFNPVSLNWMKIQCKKFNFPLPQKPVVEKNKNIKLLNEPKERISIIGDGNCWFRAISLLISGTEEFHADIRAALIKVLLKLF